ncbi:mannose-1-phosphate guanylyltransferase [Thermodesulfobacteriota bacterium]
MYAVIIAGGSGTRFWPFSRKNRPKQFLRITGNRSMIEETCDRLAPLVKDEEIIIVLGREHRDQAAALLKDRDIKILAEPIGRNTGPAIGLGALLARQTGCEGAIAFLPADHFIGDTQSFLSCLDQAGKVAESGGIVTLGIVPTRPETGYGYIRRSKSGPDSYKTPVYDVSAFVEKPDIETAGEYLTSGEYFWNAGIFVATPETILKEIEIHLSGLHEGLMQLGGPFEGDSFEQRLEEVYNRLEPISFDYGIMEKTECPVYVIPCECAWSDVGSWASLYELRERDHDASGNLSEGEAILVDCRNSVIAGKSGRLVACLGLKDCIIVDTDDALLVADLGRSQDIRRIVEKLKDTDKGELL